MVTGRDLGLMIRGHRSLRLVVMNANSSSAVSADPISVAVRSIHTMADGDRADFDPLYHPRAVDRENGQPPSSRVPGPAGFYSTALWLRAAFADLHYDIHHAVADGNLVAVNSTMNGRHVAPWAVYTDDGAMDTVLSADEQDLRDDPTRPAPMPRCASCQALGHGPWCG